MIFVMALWFLPFSLVIALQMYPIWIRFLCSDLSHFLAMNSLILPGFLFKEI